MGTSDNTVGNSVDMNPIPGWEGGGRGTPSLQVLQKPEISTRHGLSACLLFYKCTQCFANNFYLFS